MRGALQSLLVTDIVASTRLWSEHEAAMVADLELHDQLVNTAIVAAGGRVFKHTGDGVMATFDGADASAAAAAEIQRLLQVQVWRVPTGIHARIALHSGSVHEREGDLFGPPVNRLARLLSRCPMDAVLVSDASASLLVDGMPMGLTLRELGKIELRDLGHDEVVHCLVGDHLAAVEPRDVIGPSERVGSLPGIDDDLVGRIGEIAGVLDAIAAHPVVSIVGVGGMGKTRLALETAAAVGLPDGAWWCDLTAATTSDAVPAAVLASIDGRQSAGRSIVESIVDRLAGQHALIVFDNCEHVVDAARALVGAIRRECEKVRVLATSREALGLRGEHIISLSSLPADDAIGLFCTRAIQARPELVFDASTLTAVDEICEALDGIPLAIELAAARCRSMAPAEIAARLDDRFRLLRGGRSGVERHRTLQAAVDWSYSLLDDDERALFDRMAVFAGGALIDAVSTICELDEYDALDVLDRLIARSMIVASDTPLGTRYRQLETLRQYAGDRLAEYGTAEGTRDRHLVWVRGLADRLFAAAFTSAEADGFRRYVVELDNIRAAVHYASSAGRLQEACEVIAGIGYHALCRPTFEVSDWVDVARVPVEQWTDAVASTVGLSSTLTFFLGDTSRMREMLAIVPDEFAGNAWVLTAATYESLWVAGDFELAETRLGAVVPPDEREAVSLMFNRAQVFQTRVYTDRATDGGYAQRAATHMQSLVTQMRDAGAQISLATALAVSGFCLQAAGDLQGELALLSESIELSEDAGAGFTVDVARVGLVEAITQLAGTDPDRLRDSAQILQSTIEATLKRGNQMFVADYLCSAVVRVLWVSGDHRNAALLDRCVRLRFPMTYMPSNVDAGLLGADITAEIEAQAAELDIDDAAEIALAALDRVIGDALTRASARSVSELEAAEGIEPP